MNNSHRIDALSVQGHEMESGEPDILIDAAAADLAALDARLDAAADALAWPNMPADAVAAALLLRLERPAYHARGLARLIADLEL